MYVFRLTKYFISRRFIQHETIEYSLSYPKYYRALNTNTFFLFYLFCSNLKFFVSLYIWGINMICLSTFIIPILAETYWSIEKRIFRQTLAPQIFQYNRLKWFLFSNFCHHIQFIQFVVSLLDPPWCIWPLENLQPNKCLEAFRKR